MVEHQDEAVEKFPEHVIHSATAHRISGSLVAEQQRGRASQGSAFVAEFGSARIQLNGIVQAGQTGIPLPPW